MVYAEKAIENVVDDSSFALTKSDQIVCLSTEFGNINVDIAYLVDYGADVLVPTEISGLLSLSGAYQYQNPEIGRAVNTWSDGLYHLKYDHLE